MNMEQRAEMLTELVQQVVGASAKAVSDMTQISGNYVCLMMLEFLVYTLMVKAPMEAEPYLQALIGTTKQPDQSDPDFLAKREELYDILQLITAR